MDQLQDTSHLPSQSNHLHSGKYQQGMSFLLVAVILFLLVFIGNFSMKLVPAYLENYSLKEIVEGLQDNVAEKKVSAKAMKMLILRNAAMSNIESLMPNDVTVKKRGGKLTIKLIYTVEEHLMYNVSLLLSFDDTIILTTKRF